jgi:serine/threonine protein kinase
MDPVLPTQFLTNDFFNVMESVKVFLPVAGKMSLREFVKKKAIKPKTPVSENRGPVPPVQPIATPPKPFVPNDSPIFKVPVKEFVVPPPKDIPPGPSFVVSSFGGPSVVAPLGKPSVLRTGKFGKGPIKPKVIQNDVLNMNSFRTANKFSGSGCGIEVVSELGSGTYGSVYRVKSNGKFYAMKLTNILGAVEWNEISALSLRMKNVVPLEGIIANDECSEKDKLPFLLPYAIPMENHGVRKTGKNLDKNIVPDLLNGLFNLHRQGILHNDIKVPNALEIKGKYYLADLGSARFSKDVERIYGEMNVGFVGTTPGYKSPMTCLNDFANSQFYPISSKTDVFALGITFLELCARGRLLDALFKEQYYYGREQKFQQVLDVLDSQIRRDIGEDYPVAKGGILGGFLGGYNVPQIYKHTHEIVIAAKGKMITTKLAVKFVEEQFDRGNFDLAFSFFYLIQYDEGSMRGFISELLVNGDRSYIDLIDRMTLLRENLSIPSIYVNKAYFANYDDLKMRPNVTELSNDFSAGSVEIPKIKNSNVSDIPLDRIVYNFYRHYAKEESIEHSFACVYRFARILDISRHSKVFGKTKDIELYLSAACLYLEAILTPQFEFLEPGSSESINIYEPRYKFRIDDRIVKVYALFGFYLDMNRIAPLAKRIMYELKGTIYANPLYESLDADNLLIIFFEGDYGKTESYPAILEGISGPTFKSKMVLYEEVDAK